MVSLSTAAGSSFVLMFGSSVAGGSKVATPSSTWGSDVVSSATATTTPGISFGAVIPS